MDLNKKFTKLPDPGGTFLVIKISAKVLAVDTFFFLFFLISWKMLCRDMRRFASQFGRRQNKFNRRLPEDFYDASILVFTARIFSWINGENVSFKYHFVNKFFMEDRRLTMPGERLPIEFYNMRTGR